MPAIPSSLIEPLWDQFYALRPPREVAHPLGCHQPRIPDRVGFAKLVQVLVFGGAYERIADATCSATTLRRRRAAWIDAGVMPALQAIVLDAYDQMIGLELADVAVDGCSTTAPVGARWRAKAPWIGATTAPSAPRWLTGTASRSGRSRRPPTAPTPPCWRATLDTLELVGARAARLTVHLDRGYDAAVTRATLAARGLRPEIAVKGKPAPVTAGQRWVVERTHAWTNAPKKLVWCTERRAAVIAFWLAFSAVVIVVRRLIRLGWTRYRWDTRPPRRP